MKSQYRKNQEFKRMQTKTKNDYHCLGCGSRLHRSNERESKCPAWGKTCFNCNGPNHFSGVCQKPKRKPGYPRNSNGDFRSRPSNFENSKSDFQPTSSANVNMSRDGGDSESSFFFAFSGEIMDTISSSTPALPHIEWDGQKFHRSNPPPPPPITSYQSRIISNARSTPISQ